MIARRIRALAIAALAVAGIFSTTALHAQAQQATPQRARVVIQVSDADQGKWNLALNNAKNIQTDLGAANVDIEIVAYGPGIGMLKLIRRWVEGSTKRQPPASRSSLARTPCEARS